MSNECIKVLDGVFKPDEIKQLQRNIGALRHGGMDAPKARLQAVQELLGTEVQSQLEVDSLAREAAGMPQYVQPKIEEVAPTPAPEAAPEAAPVEPVAPVDPHAKLTPKQEAELVVKTPDEMRQELYEFFGKSVVDALEETGVLTLDAGRKIQKNPKGGYRSLQGVYNLRDKTITLYGGTQHVDRSTVGLLLHEGSHSGMNRLLSGRLGEYASDIVRQAAAGGEIAQRAVAQAKAAEMTPAQILANDKAGFVAREEIVAYYIQHSVDQGQASGIFRRIMNALKVTFELSLLGHAARAVGIKIELTPEMAVELAKEALRSTLEIAKTRQQLQQTLDAKSGTGGSVNSTKAPTKEQLASAEEMLGTDPDPAVQALVLRDTGVYVQDGKPKVSVDESEILIKERIDQEKVKTLEDILEDNLLFENYPELRNYSVRYARMDTGEATRNGDVIYIDSRAEDSGEIREMVLSQVDKIMADQDGWLGFEGEKTPGDYPAIGQLFAQSGDVTVQREIKRWMTDPESAAVVESVLESAVEGFYSQTARAAQELKQAKGTGKQMYQMLAKQPGVKKEELEWLGVKEWAEEQDKLTREELVSFIEQDGVQLEETDVSEPKYTGYQSSGASKNYHEVLLRLPESAEQFRAGHYDEPNVLAHVRFNERYLDRKKTLFIEEVQSDWHQEGRKRGYQREVSLEDFTVVQISEVEFKFTRKDGQGSYSGFGDTKAEAFADLKQSGVGQLLQGAGVPDAPFKTSWPSLVLKRMIRHAAKRGFQQVAWTSGKTQAERYALNKQIEALSARQEEDGTWTLFAKAKTPGSSMQELVEGVTTNELADHVGKEMAEKLTQTQPDAEGDIYLSGLDLEIGGEGMQAFYDNILRNQANKLLKRFKVRVGTDEVILDAEAYSQLRTVREVMGEDIGAADHVAQRAWSFPITPEMREEVLDEGFELFSETSDYQQNLAAAGDLISDRFLEAAGLPPAQDSEAWAKPVKPGPAVSLPEQQLLDNLREQTELESAADLTEAARKKLWPKPEESLQLSRAQRFLADYYDDMWTMEKKSEAVWDRYDLSKSRRSAMIDEVNRNFLEPMKGLVRETGLDLKQVDDWLAARHIMLDNVNQNLAERSSLQYINKLVKHLDKPARIELEAKKTELLQQKLEPKQIRKKMFNLMNEYADQEQTSLDQRTGTQRQATKEEWEDFKRHASGMYDARSGLDNRGGAMDAAEVYGRYAEDPKVAKVAELYDKMTTEQLDMLQEGGTITTDERTNLLAENPHYVPLRREKFDYESQFGFLKQGSPGPSKGVSVRGGSADVSPPIHVMQNTFAKLHGAAGSAQRNLANNFLYEEIMADRKNWTGWFTVGEDKARERHTELGFVVEGVTKGLEPTDLVVLRDGKRLVISPIEQNERAMLFAAAANRLGAQEASGVFKVFGWVNSIVRFTAISASPSFLLANMIRDPLTALYNMQATEAGNYTNEIKGKYKESFSALIDVFVRGNRDPDSPAVQMVERFEKAGGKISFTQSLKEMDSSFKSFERAMKAEGTPGIKQVVRLFEQIENTNIAIENVMRLSTFEVLHDKVGADKAARIAKDLTTNFDRRGFKSSAMGLLYLFFNATIQGNAQVIRNISKSKKLASMVGGTIVMAALFDLIGRALADEDEQGNNEWDKITGKDRNIILPIPIDGTYIKIPAPWVYNTVWRLGGMLSETAAGARTAADTASETASLVLSTFNPMGGGTVAQALTPTALDPLIQVIENKDFAGNQLRPINFPGAGHKPDSQLAWQSTPDEYKWLARKINEWSGGDVAHSGWIDVAPSTIQNTVNFLGGGLARFGMNVLGMPQDIAEQELELRNVPILRQLTTRPGTSIDTQKYYDRVAAVLSAERAVKDYGRGPTRDLEKRAEAKEKYKKELRLVSHVKDVERQLKSLRTRMRAAQGRGDKKRVEMLKERIQSVQRRFVATFESRMKK